jgi:hypothetical protein
MNMHTWYSKDCACKKSDGGTHCARTEPHLGSYLHAAAVRMAFILLVVTDGWVLLLPRTSGWLVQPSAWGRVLLGVRMSAMRNLVLSSCVLLNWPRIPRHVTAAVMGYLQRSCSQKNGSLPFSSPSSLFVRCLYTQWSWSRLFTECSAYGVPSALDWPSGRSCARQNQENSQASEVKPQASTSSFFKVPCVRRKMLRPFSGIAEIQSMAAELTIYRLL